MKSHRVSISDLLKAATAQFICGVMPYRTNYNLIDPGIRKMHQMEHTWVHHSALLRTQSYFGLSRVE